MTMAWKIGAPATAVTEKTDPDIAAQYEVYYGAGHYDRRYPRPNPAVLDRVLSCLPEGGRVLDYGCGNGRYLVPLASRAARTIGFDISRTAVATASARLVEAGLARTASVVGPDLQDLEAVLRREGPVDVAACLFGVLSHITEAATRDYVLRLLGRSVRPDTGRIIITVPNRFRRFRAEQRDQNSGASGEITYSRSLDGDCIDLSYKLFDAGSLRAELEAADLEVLSIRSETTLPEKAISHSVVAREVDRAITPFVPRRLAYGLIAIARPT